MFKFQQLIKKNMVIRTLFTLEMGGEGLRGGGGGWRWMHAAFPKWDNRHHRPDQAADRVQVAAAHQGQPGNWDTVQGCGGRGGVGEGSQRSSRTMW